MKLLYKELSLAAHPSLYAFMLLGCLVLIPVYPYTVIFMFGCLAPFITFMFARENNDAWYTATLPIQKKEIVLAAYRCPTRAIIDLSPFCYSAQHSYHRKQSCGYGHHCCLVRFWPDNFLCF